MFSNSLPFTAWDSMEDGLLSLNGAGTGVGATSGQPQPPKGFQTKDQVAAEQTEAIQKLRNAGTPMAMPPPPTLNGGGQQKAPKKGHDDVPIDMTDVELEAPQMTKGAADISNYRNVSDLLYIVIAVLAIEVIVLFAVRYLPEVFGQHLNRWYDLFGLNAVIADVMIIVVGFLIARYLYTLWVRRKFAGGQWSPLKFTGTLVGVQLIHDLLFYYGVIQQIPRGHNIMMDVFKDYAASGGAKILAGDAAMMIGSAGLAMLLKGQPLHIVASVGSLLVYAVPYILYTKNQFSALK